MFTNFGSNEYIKQEDPVDPRPKFNIFDADSDSSEKVAQAIKGSSLNHSDWVIETTNVNSFLNKLRNISSSINLHNGTIDKFFMDNYDDMLWSADKLRKTVPNINWDKIFLGLFGTTNITEKIFVMDVNLVVF